MTNPAPPSGSSPRAAVEQSVLVGRPTDGVASFKAIAYAAPPVVLLRWRALQAAEAWAGERDATPLGAICILSPSNCDPGVGLLPMSKD
jgi:para-nitrobenzyl esterase